MLFKEVEIEKRGFAPYRRFNRSIFEKTKHLARKLKKFRILHINATSSGGGVAELLKSQIALEKGLGLDSRWFVIQGAPAFFEVTKKIHNLLQGKSGFLSAKEKEIFNSESRNFGRDLPKLLKTVRPNVVLIHDPQPAGLADFLSENQPSILRIHIDLSAPNAGALEFIRPHVEKYSRVVISRKDYRPPWFPLKKIKIITPVIDPMIAKNKKTAAGQAKRILVNFGIHPERPLVSQISRFDPWKDPLGVIGAFYHAKKEIPDLQLILAGIIEAADDPEALEIFKRVERYAKGDPSIFLFSNINKLKDISHVEFINAVQTASDIILQKSIREGFGLTVTEAMWKGKVVVGGMASGIMMQIKNGKNGFLVSGPEEAGRRIIELLKNKKLCSRIGREARKSVAKNFLVPKSLGEHFELYLGVAK
ncbi:MAG: hypothetical protein A2931_01680 [Candidatus Niyogibacteria bacterium RIFCSPLOWO2_01_FULL_45_48]|uniref:Uncharacterized protein n=2 Tax=Candidatus Niyogiibacteriota TaxID=1817912 RepID=A0A1G2EZ59_9BACT|nr:MAG: hypothetical protein A2835_03980 [Candidatus Niyogibacteria bacterium RIFCSPHIGHO2_01_FULL_45_28]OGZ29473.1 MAG: hypothetical protein A2931_01680 [Candidatus Niyogibacteria bacterium RIFCSPLOWO2_01_FULL_45_48]OGZ31079.1 MAG: hypothetical protein A3J00_03245 [Candidatus Niyogibacteria bacterium RIFCSPLOWO2_02_FULL_45_13]